MFSTARSLWPHWDLCRASQQQHGGLSPWLAFSSVALFPPSLGIFEMVSTVFREKGYFWVCEWRRLCRAPVSWEVWLRILSLPIFGSTFEMGKFLSESRKLICIASLIGSLLFMSTSQMFPWHLIYVGCLCMLFILWQSQWGPLEKNKGIGVWWSSGWGPAPAPICCEALGLSLSHSWPSSTFQCLED